MDRRQIASLTAALVTVSLLPGCASKAPEKPATVASRTTVAIDGEIPGRPVSDAKAQSGYRIVNRKGEQLYCKRELVTGSRTNATETCLTKEQLERQRAGVDTMMRGLQDMNTGRQDASNGIYNNVMGPGRRD
jgi:hypothetical protein